MPRPLPLLTTLALLAAPALTRAEARIVVAVGADAGLPGEVPLRYAESDAQRVVAAFSELGGVSHPHLVTGPSATSLQATLAQARTEVAAAHAHGERALLVFYFSGHADRDFLHAGRTRLTWEKLRSLLREVGADTTVSFVDACASGGALVKGATPGEPFSVERDATQASGTVWFTSSRGDEASYESDELGGSFFTHYLVSALRGAADLDENGRVTLSEVYQFTYQQTVGETSLRLRSVQHPTFGFELSGEGDVVLTELQLARASLVLPRDLSGSYLLSRRFGARRSTVEIAKKPGALVRVGVMEGAYLFYRRDADRIWLASYDIPAGHEVVVDGADLKPRRYEDVMGKGGDVSLATWQVYAAAGGAAPYLDQSRLAAAGRIGAVRREGWSGLGLELGFSRFRFDALDTSVRTNALELGLRAEAFSETRFGLVSIGAAAAGLVLDQAADQGARPNSFAPGLILDATFERRLAGRASLRAEVSTALWFLQLDGSSGISPHLSPRFSLGLAVEIP